MDKDRLIVRALLVAMWGLFLALVSLVVGSIFLRGQDFRLTQPEAWGLIIGGALFVGGIVVAGATATKSAWSS